jgi:hypothetical protein
VLSISAFKTRHHAPFAGRQRLHQSRNRAEESLHEHEHLAILQGRETKAVKTRVSDGISKSAIAWVMGQ